MNTEQMEHEEIVLDQKRDPRNKGTRYGIKGRGTIKFNKYQEKNERKFNGELQVEYPETSVTVSLNKRKNWEVSQQSFDDSDINIRVVIAERNKNLRGVQELEQKVREERRVQAKLEEKQESYKTEIVNGSNRKGFFVREKRKPGKKGVNRNTSKSDGDTLDVDQIDNEPQNDKEEVVLCILTAARNRRADFWNQGDGGCNCRQCRGIWEKNITDRNRKLVKQEAIDLL